MTRALSPITCDVCGKEVSRDNGYTFELQKISTKRGQFVKSKRGDMCHADFMKLKDNGFEPKWVTITLNPETKKWESTESD